MALRLLRHLSSSTTTSTTTSSSLAADINAIARILSDNRFPSSDLATALRPFLPRLASDPSLLDHLLIRCRHLPLPSHRLFLLCSSPSPLSHRLLIHLLSSSRHFPLAWAHLSDLHHSKSPALSPSLFPLFFSAYSKASLPSDAIKSFTRIPDFGFQQTTQLLNILLYALCKHKHVKQAEAFFHTVKHKFTPTNKTYTILINGWVYSMGQANDAVKLFDEMCNREDSKIDIAAYNALILALCKGGEIDEASKRMREMKTVHGLEPDAGTYAAFIRAYCDAKDSRGALRMIENMKRKGLTPNVFTYNCVIKLLCEEEGKAEEAYELLNEMVEVPPDVWSYNRIMALHCKLREVNKAFRLMKRMDEDKCLPDRHTYNMLMKMLIGVGRIDKAMEVWDGMEARGFYPRACSYAVIIHGLCRKKGWAKEASRYFEVMVDEGIPPYVDTCMLLRNELLRMGLREKVEVLVDGMRRSTSCVIQELSSVMESGKEMER